jgi:hypothetical protein
MGVSVVQRKLTHTVIVTGTKNLLKPPQVIVAAGNLAASWGRMRSLIGGSSKLLCIFFMHQVGFLRTVSLLCVWHINQIPSEVKSNMVWKIQLTVTKALCYFYWRSLCGSCKTMASSVIHVWTFIYRLTLSCVNTFCSITDVDLFELPGMRIIVHPALWNPHLIQITLRTTLMTSILADQMVKSFTYFVLGYSIFQKSEVVCLASIQF